MKCWKCDQEVSGLNMKIGFRAICPHCGIDLHTCTNCRYYMPGKPNDCAVPGTDSIRDREAFNFCEEFKIKTESPPNKKETSKFNSLFKDDPDTKTP